MSELAKQSQHYTQEIIDEMRRLGMPKPDDCDYAVWHGPKSLDAVIAETNYSTIIELLMLGWQKQKIAETLGYHKSSLSRLINSPSFKSCLEMERRKRSEAITKTVLNRLYLPAVETLEKVMLDESEKGATRLAAAMYAIDQTVGKPEQKVHTTGSILSEVIHHIEELKSRNVDPDIEVASQPVDPMESFVNNFIDGDFKVGKRGEGGREG